MKNLLRRIQIANKASKKQSHAQGVGHSGAIADHLFKTVKKTTCTERNAVPLRQGFLQTQKYPDADNQGIDYIEDKNKTPGAYQQYRLSDARSQGWHHNKNQHDQRHHARHFITNIFVA